MVQPSSLSESGGVGWSDAVLVVVRVAVDDGARVGGGSDVAVGLLVDLGVRVGVAGRVLVGVTVGDRITSASSKPEP